MQKEELRKELYEKIRGHHGAMNAVAAKCGMHRTTVSRILCGMYENPAVLEAAAIVLVEYEEEAARSLANTEQLLNRAIQAAIA